MPVENKFEKNLKKVLTKTSVGTIIITVETTTTQKQRHVCLAQLDRAFGYGPKGRGFESSSARTKNLQISLQVFLLCRLSFSGNGFIMNEAHRWGKGNLHSHAGDGRRIILDQMEDEGNGKNERNCNSSGNTVYR